MFLRSIFYPSMLACAIGAPLLYSTSQHGDVSSNGQLRGQRGGWGSNENYDANAIPNRYPARPLPTTTTNGVTIIPPANGNAFATGTRPPTVQSQNAPLGQLGTASGQPMIVQNPAANASSVTPTRPPSQLTTFAAGSSTFNSETFGGTFGSTLGGTVGQPTTLTSPMSLPTSTNLPPGMMIAGPNGVGSAIVADPAMLGMTPDFGAAQTFTFPGNAQGPDLTAKPLDFIPVTDFAEIIRFDIFPNWVKSRWSRVSTNPGGAGLHGLRVALVTGTNSWDLHGSLTYYFDANQRAQRITFRGWTGDSGRLVNLLTSRFGLKAQPTHWAGAYVAQDKRGRPTGGLLMQHPAVITRDNPVQQVALVMELNHPEGSFPLSEEFIGQLRHSMQIQ